MPLETIYDVIIIGGGLAGSASAFHLTRYGYRVLCLEKETAGHHTVCGEFLSAETFPYLLEMGVDLEALGASEISGVQFYSRYFQSHLPLLNRAKGLSRFRLDEACLIQAQKAGVEVKRGVTATDFQKDKDHSLFLIHTSHGVFRSHALFLAVGKHEMKKFHVREGKENSAIGFKMHLTLSSLAKKRLNHDTALYFYRGGYAGFCPIEEGLVNFCLIVDKRLFKQCGNRFDLLVLYLKNENRRLTEILEGSSNRWPKPQAISSLPYGYIHQPEQQKERLSGIYHLGDQFAVIPSLTGSGMAIALFTAKKAAEHYHRDQLEGYVRYEEESFATIRSAMNYAYPLHCLFRSPFLADLSVFLLKPFPSLVGHLIHQTRIPSLMPAQH